MARLLILLLGVSLTTAATTKRSNDSDPGQAAARDPKSLQFLLKDRQGLFVSRSPASADQHFEKRHNEEGLAFEDHYRPRQQSYDDFHSGGSSESYDGFQGARHQTYDESFHAGQHTYDGPPDTNYDVDRETNQLSFTGSHVARHPIFDEPTSAPKVKFPFSSHGESVNSHPVFPPIPTKSSTAKPSSFTGFSPLFSSRPSSGTPSVAATASADHQTGQERDDFVHHTSSSYDDPQPYHVQTTYHEPATYHGEEKGGLFGNLGKYGGVMAPLLLATGLLFLFPSVQTITSTSSRRRRDLGAAEEFSADRTSLLVERLQTIYASIDEEDPCLSRLFCQLGDVISESPSPARVIEYMDHFYPGEDLNVKIVKKAVYAEDPKCHLLECDAKNNQKSSDQSQT